MAYLALDHLALAALFAMLLRFLLDMLSARALPPFSPPLRPISARYSWIGVRSGFSSFSSVESRTISAALSIGSFGSFFLERIMHPFVTQIRRGRKGGLGVSELKVAHYLQEATGHLYHRVVAGSSNSGSMKGLRFAAVNKTGRLPAPLLLMAVGVDAPIAL